MTRVQMFIAAAGFLALPGLLLFMGTMARDTGRRDRDQSALSMPYSAVERAADGAAKSQSYSASRRAARALDALEFGEVEDLPRAQQYFGSLRNYFIQSGGKVDEKTRLRLIQLVLAGDVRWRSLAGDALGHLEADPRTVRVLVDALKKMLSSDPATRRAILLALGGMRAAAAAPALIELIETDIEEKELIVQAVGRIGEPESLGELIPKLGENISDDVRSEIELALTQESARPAFDDAVAVIETSPAAQQQSMLDVLWRVGDPQHAPAVLGLLGTEMETQSRSTAIRALGAFGDVESARELWRMLHGEHEQDRRDAQRALRRLNNAETIDVLITEAEEMSLVGRRALLHAGRKIEEPGPKLLELAHQELETSDRPAKLSAIVVIGNAAGDDSIEPLIRLFDSTERVEIRVAVLDALLAIGSPASVREGVSAAGRLADADVRQKYIESYGAVVADAPESD